MSRRRWLASSLLLILTVSVLVGAVVLVAYLQPSPTTSMTTVATDIPRTTTPTLPTTLDAAWVRAPSGTLGIPITVPGMPNLLYACGAPQGDTVQFSASGDGGFNWSAPVSVAPGAGCALSADPNNAAHLALVVLGCNPDACTQPQATPNRLFRSADGGATWQEAALPVGNAGVQFGSLLAWSAGTLLVTVQPTTADGVTRHVLVADSGTGTLVWIDQGGALFLRTGATGDTVRQILTLADSIDIVIQEGATLRQGIDGYQQRLVRSVDGGRSWAAVRFTDNGQDVRLIRVGQDGKTLVGLEQGTTLVTSSDGGQNWQKKPALAQGTLAFLDLTPDATFVGVYLTTTASQNQLAIVSGTAWSTLSQHGPATIAAVTPDSAGHPLIAWGSLSDSAGHKVYLVYRIAT